MPNSKPNKPYFNLHNIMKFMSNPGFLLGVLASSSLVNGNPILRGGGAPFRNSVGGGNSFQNLGRPSTSTPKPQESINSINSYEESSLAKILFGWLRESRSSVNSTPKPQEVATSIKPSSSTPKPQNLSTSTVQSTRVYSTASTSNLGSTPKPQEVATSIKPSSSTPKPQNLSTSTVQSTTVYSTASTSNLGSTPKPQNLSTSTVQSTRVYSTASTSNLGSTPKPQENANSGGILRDIGATLQWLWGGSDEVKPLSTSTVQSTTVYSTASTSTTTQTPKLFVASSQAVNGNQTTAAVEQPRATTENSTSMVSSTTTSKPVVQAGSNITSSTQTPTYRSNRKISASTTSQPSEEDGSWKIAAGLAGGIMGSILLSGIIALIHKVTRRQVEPDNEKLTPALSSRPVRAFSRARNNSVGRANSRAEAIELTTTFLRAQMEPVDDVISNEPGENFDSERFESESLIPQSSMYSQSSESEEEKERTLRANTSPVFERNVENSGTKSATLVRSEGETLLYNSTNYSVGNLPQVNNEQPSPVGGGNWVNLDKAGSSCNFKSQWVIEASSVSPSPIESSGSRVSRGR